MSDNILSAVLTFSVLVAGTAAIGAEMFNTRRAEMTVRPVVTLPQVSIVAHRQAAAEYVVLPMVTITGRRDASTRVAVETSASEASRVE